LIVLAHVLCSGKFIVQEAVVIITVVCICEIEWKCTTV